MYICYEIQTYCETVYQSITSDIIMLTNLTNLALKKYTNS